MFTVSKIYRTSRLDNYVALLLLICSGRCFHYCNIVNGYNIIIISFIQKQYEDESNQEPSITPKRVVSNMIGNYLIDSCYTELTITKKLLGSLCSGDSKPECYKKIKSPQKSLKASESGEIPELVVQGKNVLNYIINYNVCICDKLCLLI